MFLIHALTCGVVAWSAPSPSKIERNYPHFAHAEVSRPVAARLDLLVRLHPDFLKFLTKLHSGFDARVRTLVEDVVCREALTESDAPELLVRLGMLRLRLRNLLIAASWLEPGHEPLDDLAHAFNAFFMVDGFDTANVALEDWGKQLERAHAPLELSALLGEARRLWLAAALELQSQGGEMTGRSTDRLQ